MKYSPEYLPTMHWYGRRPQEHKNLPKTATTAVFQPHDEDNWLFYRAHATLQALYLRFMRKKGTESRHRKQERETKLGFFVKVSESSFRVVSTRNIILGDVWRFK